MIHRHRMLPCLALIGFGALAACGKSPGNLRGVGGTASGLSGTGLVLLLNGGSALTLAPGASSFRFDAVIAEGSEYRVTVGTQPANPTQTCLVTGGAGTAGGSDVSGVAVHCTTNTYAVGGLVNGLQGSGLRLHLDGQADLAVSADGSFAFPVPVESGLSYAVTVAVQPTGPEQVCTVVRGAGQVVAADVTNVLVSCANALSVGGTVAGLQGTGLLLRLDAQAPLALAGNGAFTFPGKIANGSTWQVAVVQQPSNPTQTCTVTNGSGTATADVTSVAVTCTTNAYAVGGTVSGLTGTGLTLLLNGGGSLAVPGNGVFTFPGKVASGATWAVTVGTHPSGPTQTCSVAGGAGTMAAADVATVAVTCATSSYAVGGTVSGLTGTGLTLLLNGQGTLAISANGPFAFTGRVASGGTYAVTVGTQPSGPTQTCAVASGAGTVTSADVGNVAVTCTTNTYAVGGAVSGLSGTGLTLLLNGGGSLAVSGNGAFTFPGKVASGATWAVTVGTQPSGPTQTCAVAGGTGTIAAADVATVAVSCTTNSYAVGGVVSGLSGTGLALSLNGAAPLAINANGGFTFPGRLLSGTAYAVAVASQPVAPLQVCSVSAGTGTVAGSDVSVAVGCAFAPPTLTGPVDQSAYPGSTATFTVAPSGNGPFTYQWQRGGTVLASTGPSLTTNPVAAADEGAVYSVLVTDSRGLSASGSATLHLKAWTGFAATGPMASPRSAHTATLLPGGKVLVAGGENAIRAELFDPVAGTFSPTGSLSVARTQHTATLLGTGKVLIAGGVNRFSSGFATAELYDPAAGTFTATGSMSIPRYGHTATLLPGGKVLIAGGVSALVRQATAELYDPVAGTFSATGSMATARDGFTATLLATGSVLVTGGAGLASAELYAPGSGAFSATGSMSTQRVNHFALALPDATVLVGGGYNGGTLPAPVTLEQYNPTTFSFSTGGTMSNARLQAAVALRSDGKALITGGSSDGSTPVTTADLFDPTPPRTAAPTGSMGTARLLHTLTALPDGRVLAVGGRDAGRADLAGAEVYR